jgi:2-C-methyl-D-erythritol 2,4-cyclodiphosphate synthase
MRKILGQLMNVSEDEVSVKATTSEKLSFVGNEEGIKAYAVALIYKKI